MRLLVWGRKGGVVEGRLGEHLESEGRRGDLGGGGWGNKRPRELAVDILMQLHRSMTD